jgi:hypothetical protein
MNKQRSTIGSLQIAIIVLAVATAVIHFYLAFARLIPELGFGGGVPFILNGIGYLVLVGALYAPSAALVPRRSLIRWVLMGYTALTVLLWVFIGSRDAIAYIDKIIEVALILLLFMDSRQNT